MEVAPPSELVARTDAAFNPNLRGVFVSPMLCRSPGPAPATAVILTVAPTRFFRATCVADRASAAVFGLTAVPGQHVYFVDDGTNTLDFLGH